MNNGINAAAGVGSRVSVIRKLDALTISKIAAGEVIDRPASVVKELVENSIDAGATRISIAIADGGLGLIRIADNGIGIHPDDLALALTPHATSKIREADDIFSTLTMGFRGEALASICQVSRIAITSGTVDGVGYRISGVYGEIGPIQPESHPKGTTITVETLFGEMPVRQKFIKSAATEFSYISDIIIGIALAYPEIGFELSHNGKSVVNTMGINRLRDRAAVLISREAAQGLVDIDYRVGDYRVQGVVASPTVTTASRGKQYVTVNRRLVKSPTLLKAITQAYADSIPPGRFPVAVLNVTLPGDSIDINIHPQKQDIRF
ncbi:DNA mismatch repair endonuclease MutL, partial [bacterium]|nr:DNA mismatch repair endonuclease MutL [bacterium]